MASNQSNFVPMAGPVRDVFDVLAELIDFECDHQNTRQHTTDDKGNVVCDKVTLTNLEEAAVRIADMIDKGEL